ncbi:hypothetical protein A2379_03600 [Candidatus Amesbacteria bacterium RIFOXYB1_FULL_47_13]|nr:MAG: hypothetical protein A2379_03600 [Candidatus Amesbacteria bacterium RIFOXYB1_FULL_47_13]
MKQIVSLVLPGLTILLLPQFVSAQSLVYIHSDHLGSTALATDTSGRLVSKQNYYPYGTTRSASGSLSTEKQYTGQVSDTDSTGLYYYNARYYNPSLAKFTQADSLGSGLNLYAYVNNDPSNQIDPSGHQNCDPEDYYCRHLPDSGTTLINTYVGEDEITSTFSQLASSFSLFDPILRQDVKASIYGTSISIPPNSIPSLVLTSTLSFRYWPFSNSVVLPDPSIAGTALDKFEEGYQHYIPEFESDYNWVFEHETRHFWQFNSPNIFKNYSFLGQVAKRAYESGLTQGAKYAPFMSINYPLSLLVNATSGDIDVDTPIRPHGSLLGIIPLWSNRLEIDAIIAETMMEESTRADFRNNYPAMWNLMLSKPGYFNPEVFKPVTYRTMYENRH